MLRTLLLLQVIVLPPQPDARDPYRLPPVAGPTLSAIEPRADSVLFLTVPQPYYGSTSTTIYAFERSSGRWGRAGVSGDGHRADPLELLLGRMNVMANRVPLGDDDMALVWSEPIEMRTRDQRDSVVLWHRLVRGPGDTMSLVLKPPPEPRDRNASTRISAVLLEPDTLWLGLFGFPPDDMWGGDRSGLVAVDPKEGTARALWLPELREATVTSIARIGGALWVASGAGIGIRAPDGRWRWLTTSTSGLRSNAVGALAADGDTTWVATGAGPMGVPGASWFGPRWVPRLDADSIVMDLTREPPAWDERDAILRLGWLLRLGPAGARFVEAMQALPPDWLHEWRAGGREYSDVLLHPSLYPLLAEGYLDAPGPSVYAQFALEADLGRSEAMARDFLDRVDRARGVPDARGRAYTMLRGRPELLLEDARKVLSRPAPPRRDTEAATWLAGTQGDASDLPAVLRHGEADGRLGYWAAEAVEGIVSRTGPDALVDALHALALEERLEVLYGLSGWRAPEGGARPSAYAECVVALEGLRDTAVPSRQRAGFAEVLDRLGLTEPIPLLVERGSWYPGGFVARAQADPELAGGVPLDPEAPGFDARAWIRGWWRDVGSRLPPTDCETLR